MLWQEHYQCRTPKILMLSPPVPGNLHRNIIVILTPHSHRLIPQSHMPHDFTQSRSISRTLIAISHQERGQVLANGSIWVE